MGREALDATATAVATRAALAAVVVAAVVILPAVLAGILDHLGRARRFADALHRVSPPFARKAAALLLAGAATVSLAGRIGPAHAEAGSSSVREWLDGSTTTRVVDGAAPTSTWYADPADPTGDSRAHGTIGLDDLDARTTTSAPAETTTTTTSTPPRRPRRTTTTSAPRYAPPPYAIDAPPSSATPAAATDRYTVVPGDCLWTIAANRLPATAAAAEVDRAWRAIYDANRAVIGTDPNLIRPGQILELPPLPTSA